MDREYFYAIHASGKGKSTVKFTEMSSVCLIFGQISSILTTSKFEHFDNICKMSKFAHLTKLAKLSSFPKLIETQTKIWSKNSYFTDF